MYSFPSYSLWLEDGLGDSTPEVLSSPGITFCELEDLWYVLNADDAERVKLPVGDEPSIAVASSANSVDEILVLDGLTGILCLLTTSH